MITVAVIAVSGTGNITSKNRSEGKHMENEFQGSKEQEIVMLGQRSQTVL